MPANEPGEHIRHEPYRTAHTFWSHYVSEAAQYDKHLTESWKGNMDSTLIFAGLFSAVVSAFIIESYKLLKEDSGDATTVLLTQILTVLSSNSSSVPVIPTASSSSNIVPSHSAIAINILWFLSLTCSLGAALITILVQQWIRDYLRHIEQCNDPHERARIRTFLSNGMERWRMGVIVHCIPTLLHISLFLFFAGLYVFLTPINRTVAHAVLPIILCSAALYGLVTAAPLLDPSCPYETSFSSLFWRIVYYTQQALLYGMGYICRHLHYSHPLIQSFREWCLSPYADLLSLQEVRYELALNPQDPNIAYAMDARAFVWLHDQVSGDGDLQIFLDCLPEFIASDNGQKKIELVLYNKDNRATLRIGLHRLLSLVKDRSGSSLGQQALVCISALSPILVAMPPRQLGPLFPYPNPTFLTAALISKNATLSTICFCVLTMRHCTFDIDVIRSKMEFLNCKPETHTLLFDTIGNMRRVLGDVAAFHEGSHHLEDIVDLVQIYCATLKSKSLELHQWSHCFAKMMLLPYIGLLPKQVPSSHQWFRELHSAGEIEFSCDISNVTPRIDWDTVFHGQRLLAFMRATGFLEPLQAPGTPDISPLQISQPSPTINLYQDIQFHFLQEIHPLLVLLNLAEAKHQTRVTMEPGNYDEVFLLVIRIFGPLKTARHVLRDSVDHNHRMVALLELIVHLRQRPDIIAGDPDDDTSILRKTIDGLEIIDDSIVACDEEFFVGVLYAILTLERKDISNGKAFVLPESETEYLISFIQYFKRTDMISLSIAEQLFDAVATSETPVIQWGGWSTPSWQPSAIQPQIHGRWKALHDRVVEERRLFLLKMQF